MARVLTGQGGRSVEGNGPWDKAWGKDRGLLGPGFRDKNVLQGGLRYLQQVVRLNLSPSRNDRTRVGERREEG
jgi:hypothetical protein